MDTQIHTGYLKVESIEVGLMDLSHHLRERNNSEDMDIVGRLVQEHRHMRELYEAYLAIPPLVGKLAEREAKANALKRFMCEHTGREESVLYPFMAKKLEHTKEADLVERSIADHQELNQELYNLECMDIHADSVAYDLQLVKIMRELLKHMTEEEEGLPEFASKCSLEELMQLRRDFDSAIVAIHPHPLAPRRGLPAKIAAVCARPIDLLRDAFSGCTQGQCGRGGAGSKGVAKEEEQPLPPPKPEEPVSAAPRNVAVPRKDTAMRKHQQPTSIVASLFVNPDERKSSAV